MPAADNVIKIVIQDPDAGKAPAYRAGPSPPPASNPNTWPILAPSAPPRPTPPVPVPTLTAPPKARPEVVGTPRASGDADRAAEAAAHLNANVVTAAADLRQVLDLTADELGAVLKKLADAGKVLLHDEADAAHWGLPRPGGDVRPGGNPVSTVGLPRPITAADVRAAMPPPAEPYRPVWEGGPPKAAAEPAGPAEKLEKYRAEIDHEFDRLVKLGETPLAAMKKARRFAESVAATFEATPPPLPPLNPARPPRGQVETLALPDAADEDEPFRLAPDLHPAKPNKAAPELPFTSLDADADREAKDAAKPTYGIAGEAPPKPTTYPLADETQPPKAQVETTTSEPPPIPLAGSAPDTFQLHTEKPPPAKVEPPPETAEDASRPGDLNIPNLIDKAVPDHLRPLLGLLGGKGGTGGAIANVAAGGEVEKGGLGGMEDVAGGKLALIEAAAKTAKQAFDIAAAGAQVAGKGLSQFAGNDHLGMFTTATDAAEKVLKKIPIVGEAAASALGALTAPVKAFTQVVDAFVERGKQLQGFSGNLAASNAQADLRSMQSDIKEAQSLGAQLSRMTDDQSRAENSMREILLPIKGVFTTVIARIMERLATFIETVEPIFLKGFEMLGIMVDALAELVKHVPFGEKISEDLKEMAKALKGEKEPQVDPIQGWLDAGRGLGPGQVPANPAAGASQVRLNTPFGGIIPGM